MAYALIWSPLARDDLRDLVWFIASDNPDGAASFGYELIRRAEALSQLPEMGRMVPERQDPRIRAAVTLFQTVRQTVVARIFNGGTIAATQTLQLRSSQGTLIL